MIKEKSIKNYHDDGQDDEDGMIMFQVVDG